MKRRLLALTRWSLLLSCVLIAVPWAASFRWGYVLERSSDNGQTYQSHRGIQLARGGLRVWIEALRLRGRGIGVNDHVNVVQPYPTPHENTRWGFRLEYAKTSGDFYIFDLVIPLWPLVVLLAIPTALLFRSHRRLEARARDGGCAACGYDLRASPDRCPECGAASPRRATL